jgi:hypothetical protein
MKKKNNETTDVASFSTKNDKLKITKLKHGTARENDFFKLIEKMFKGQNVDIMECDKVPEVVLDFKKKDENKLN